MIQGYWKDTNENFDGYIVTDYDDELGDYEPYTDDDIFFYGLGEVDLQQAVELGWDTMLDFVVEGYKRIVL
jgi:hypothetical protein